MANSKEYPKAAVSGKQKKPQAQQAASPIQHIERLGREFEACQIELEVKNQELRQFWRALEEIGEHYASLYDSAPIGYFALDCQGHIQEINLAGADMLGAERLEIVGKLFSTWIVQRDIPAFLSFLKAMCQKEGKVVQELRLKRPDGKMIHAHLESMAGRGQGERAANYCYMALLDSASRFHSQVQWHQHWGELSQSAQLTLLGELGAGLAHEINQPLAAIASYAQECARRLRTSSRDEASLLNAVEEIAIQAERASEIVKRLRQWAPRELQRSQAIQINEIIVRAIKLVEPRLNYEGISVSLAVPNDLPPVFVNPTEVEQVLLNLLESMIDGMRGDPSSARELKLTVGLNKTQEIEVKVSNVGLGPAIERLGQVLESFFSAPSAGLGLRLVISRSLIEKHGGKLWAMPCWEQGATFCFTLPVQDNQNE